VTLLAFSGYAGSIDPSPSATTMAAEPTPPTVMPDASIYPVSELDQQPVPTYQPRPLYPFEMKQQGLSGQVVVELVLDTKGIVTSAFVISSTQRGFEASAIQAVSHWHFRAGRKDGVAVRTRMHVPIVFTLNQEGVIPATNPSARPSPAPPTPVGPAPVAPAIAMATASSNVPPAAAPAKAIAAVAPAPPAPALPAARAQIVVLARDRDPVVPPVKPGTPPVVAQSTPIPSGPQLFQPLDLDEQPKPTKQPRPVYPFDMKNKGISGRVLIEFIVDSNGMVQNAHALSSTQRTFENSAVFAVSKWQFKPGRKGGVVVNTLKQVPIIFSLNLGG
jgi:protein TonB